MNKVCSVALCLFLSTTCFASDSALVYAGPQFNADNLIVKFKKTARLKQLSLSGAFLGQALIPELGLYLIHLQPEKEFFSVLKKIQALPEVEFVQKDYLLTERADNIIPNDPLFPDQWALAEMANSADINAQEAWSFGTGGFNRYGEELTVAIIDTGFNLTHEDLKENIWTNSAEIPDNGVDDDENGYVDDIHGWNVYRDNGTLPLGQGHGTAVAGVIGASGNNKLGISGVNWKINLLLVAGQSLETNVVVKSYGYVLKQKQLYQESYGKKGANIVAINASWGQDFVKCDSGDYPIWNSLYEALGEAGVLSVVAASNQNANVDEKGDVPATCSSDYLLVTTASMDRFDLRMNVGHGPKSVDLAAPGYYVRSTDNNGRYTSFTGTSFAAPHVAAAVALMHGAASLNFLETYQDNPGKGALILKDILLESTAPVASFKGLTVTGGKLDLFAAVKAIASY